MIPLNTSGNAIDLANLMASQFFGTQLASEMPISARFKSPSAAHLSGFGTFCNYFGLKYGIVLSTGEVRKINGGKHSGEDKGKKGVSDEYATLTINFTAPADGIASFKYIFASQEMPKYFGSKYNDHARIMMNGLDVAKLPNGKLLTINNVGRSKSQKSTWIKEFVQVPSTAPKGVPPSLANKGYVKVLSASKAIKKGKNTLTITVDDRSDGKYNTMFFVEGNSFSFSNKATPSPAR